MFGANGSDGMDVKNFLKVNGGGVINSAVMSIKDEQKEDGSSVKVTVIDIEMTNLAGGAKISLELDSQVTDLCGNGISLASKKSPEKTVMPILAGSLKSPGTIQSSGSNKGAMLSVNFEVNLIDINGNNLDPNISLYDLTYSLDAAGAKIATVARTGSGKGRVTFKLVKLSKPAVGNLIVKQNATKEELGGLEPAQFTIPIKYTYRKIDSITLSKPKLTLKRKKSYTLKVTKILPASATFYKGKKVWKSSKTSVATVNAAGKVTAKKKKGTAYITCTIDGRVSNKCKVTVK